MNSTIHFSTRQNIFTNNCQHETNVINITCKKSTVEQNEVNIHFECKTQHINVHNNKNIEQDIGMSVIYFLIEQNSFSSEILRNTNYIIFTSKCENQNVDIYINYNSNNRVNISTNQSDNNNNNENQNNDDENPIELSIEPDFKLRNIMTNAIREKLYQFHKAYMVRSDERTGRIVERKEVDPLINDQTDERKKLYAEGWCCFSE